MLAETTIYTACNTFDDQLSTYLTSRFMHYTCS